MRLYWIAAAFVLAGILVGVGGHALTERARKSAPSAQGEVPREPSKTEAAPAAGPATWVDLAALGLGAIGVIIGVVGLWQNHKRPPSPVHPVDWQTKVHADLSIFQLLDWRRRLAPLIGRGEEKAELLRWAKQGTGLKCAFSPDLAAPARHAWRPRSPTS